MYIILFLIGWIKLGPYGLAFQPQTWYSFSRLIGVIENQFELSTLFINKFITLQSQKRWLKSDRNNVRCDCHICDSIGVPAEAGTRVASPGLVCEKWAPLWLQQMFQVPYHWWNSTCTMLALKICLPVNSCFSSIVKCGIILCSVGNFGFIWWEQSYCVCTC